MNRFQKTGLVGLIILLALASALLPAFAETVDELQIDDAYKVITIHGSAWTRIGNMTVRVPASIELVVRVTEVYGDFVFFRAVEGRFRIDGATYWIVPEWWRGVYNKAMGTGNFEGHAKDYLGNDAYFVIHTVDIDTDSRGVLMDTSGIFRDPNAKYWRLHMLTLRYKLP